MKTRHTFCVFCARFYLSCLYRLFEVTLFPVRQKFLPSQKAPSLLVSLQICIKSAPSILFAHSSKHTDTHRKVIAPLFVYLTQKSFLPTPSFQFPQLPSNADLTISFISAVFSKSRSASHQANIKKRKNNFFLENPPHK